MEEVVSMHCFDTCDLSFVYPKYFLARRKTDLKRIFEWLFEFDYCLPNQKTISFLDDALPVLIEDKKSEVEEARGLCEHIKGLTRWAVRLREAYLKAAQKELDKSEWLYKTYVETKQRYT